MTDPILAAEDALRDAMLANDVAALDRLLHERLLFTALDGTVVGKSFDLAFHRDRRLRLSRFERTDCRIERFGSTAIVSVEVDHEGTLDGAPVSGRLRYTRVWMEGADGWRIVGGHMSAIAAG